MSATTSNSWMPTPGRYDVEVGPSLGKALKARKGIKMNSKMPARDFYAFRYNFKPESVDQTKPGTIEVRKGKDSTSVTVERASVQPGEGGYGFIGNEIPAKEWECVLIYDEDSGRFTLEKLDSCVTLTYDRKTATGPKHTASPPARPSPANTPHPTQAAAPSSRIQSTQARNSVDELEAALERDLGGLDEDAEGEPDDEFDTLAIERPPPPPPKKATIPTQQKKAKQKSTAAAQKVSTLKAAAKAKDDGDESEGQIPLAQVVQRPKAKPLAKGAQPKPKAPKQPVSITLPSKPRPTQTKPIPASGASAPLKSTPKATAGTKRAHPEEETFQISLPPQPTRVAKRPRPSPPPVPQPPKPMSLALPSGGDGISLPGAPSSSFPTLPASINPMPTTQTLATVPQPAVPATLDSDDEDWDDALPPSPPDTGIPSHVPGRIVMEEIVPEPSRHFEEPVPLPMTLDDLEVDGEEIDEGLFEMELNQHLEEESDSDMLAYSMENTVMGDSVPISLSRAAGGGEADPIWGEYDDTSSSDDSDDD